MTTMMPNIFGNYGPDPMLQQSPQGLESILMPLQGIQGPLQQIVSEMPGQINSYVDEEIQRRMDEMKTTPSPTPTPTDPVGPPQDPFQDPSPFPIPPFLLDRLRGRQRFGQGSYQIPRPIAGLPSIFG